MKVTQLPSIPAEILEEMEKLQAFQKALEALTGADIPKQESSPHARTLKGIEDARQQRENSK